MLLLVVLDLTSKEVTLFSISIECVAVENLCGASLLVFVQFTELLHGSFLQVDDELVSSVATVVPHDKRLHALCIGVVGVPTAVFI